MMEKHGSHSYRTLVKESIGCIERQCEGVSLTLACGHKLLTNPWQQTLDSFNLLILVHRGLDCMAYTGREDV